MKREKKKLLFRTSITIFVFFLLLLAFTSCLTVSKIERNCDQFAKVCITETVKEIVYRDTTIYRTDTVFFTLPADTVRITDTLQILNNQVNLAPVKKEFGNIVVKAAIKWPVLSIEAFYKDSTLLIPRTDTIFIADAFAQVTEKNTVVVKERFIPKFYKFTLWVFIILSVLAVAWIGLQLVGAKLLGFIFKILKI